MLADIVEALRCPVCTGPLSIEHTAVRCPSGHSFDIASEGYVNLLPGGSQASTADTPAMVRARRAFLDAGHFAPVYDAVGGAVAASVAPDTAGVYLDAGAGTGHLLAALLDRAPQRRGIALDISKHAIRVAARAHPHLGAIVADVWAALPVRSASAALVTSVFAPRNAEEFSRVLIRHGALVVVAPNDAHLRELVGPLGLLDVDPYKRERLSAKLSPLFDLVAETPVEYRVRLSRDEAVAAAGMGPSAAHVSAEELALRAGTLNDPLEVTISVIVLTYLARSEVSATS